MLGLYRDDRRALGDREADQIGEVILLLRVAVVDLLQPGAEAPRAQGIEAGVDLSDRAFGGRGVAGLHDALDAPAAVAHDAPVRRGVVEIRRQNREAVARGREQALERRGL